MEEEEDVDDDVFVVDEDVDDDGGDGDDDVDDDEDFDDDDDDVCFSFGMFHDGEGNRCTKTTGTLMSPTLVSKDGQFHWSLCSKTYLMKFMK